MATDIPQTEEEKAGIAERDENQRLQYEDRIIDKKTKMLEDNYKYETVNTVGKDGKVTTTEKLVGGYRVFLND